MPDIRDQYIETTNLYWEMLWKAQRMEDKKLVQLIRRRIKEMARQAAHQPCACRIIPFPAVPAPAMPQPRLAAFSFWPKYPLIGTLAFLAAYFMLILANLAGDIV